MKAKVEASLQPAPTDHNATNHHAYKNREEKLEEESLPLGAEYKIWIFHDNKIYKGIKSVLSSFLNKGPVGF